MTRLITPEQTLSAARQAGFYDKEIKITGIAVLTFSKAVVDRLEELCGLKDSEWLSPSHHPYATSRIVKRGEFQGWGVTLLVPPMGASPLACTIEDLVTCGVNVVFLVCDAWSLGPPIEFGDLIVPAFSIGPDGTSIHYGNDESEVHAAPKVVDALAESCQSLGARHHTGGNGTCEAIYRITSQMVEGFRTRGCLCMDNGEASTLISATRTMNITGGVLFQPYIDLNAGWDSAILRGEQYHTTCRLQAEVALQAGGRLMQQTVLESK